MGNANEPQKVNLKKREDEPEQFVTQSYDDWKRQMKEVFETRPTLTRTVILPSGVALNDPRLAEGVIVQETRRVMLSDELENSWPTEHPFEADVDAKLLPPCAGRPKIHTHYAVYPNDCFEGHACGHCDLHKAANPHLMQFPKRRDSASFPALTEHEMAVAQEL